jgi:hypothetical protein
MSFEIVLCNAAMISLLRYGSKQQPATLFQFMVLLMLAPPGFSVVILLDCRCYTPNYLLRSAHCVVNATSTTQLLHTS